MIKKSTIKLSLNNEFLLIFKKADRNIADVKIYPGMDELNIEIFPTSRSKETDDLIIKLYGEKVEFHSLDESGSNIPEITFELQVNSHI